MIKRGVVLVGLVLAGVSLLTTLTACGGSSEEFDAVDDHGSEPADYLYEIPSGAGAQLDEGVALEILPAALDVKVGDVIELINHDERGHLVGPFFVGPDETVRHRFTSTGEFVGICSVHPSGEIVLTVTQ